MTDKQNEMPDIIFASDNNLEFPGLWVREDGADETDTPYIRRDIITPEEANKTLLSIESNYIAELLTDEEMIVLHKLLLAHGGGDA